jgi:alpha-N-acetylglucosamine transferase
MYDKIIFLDSDLLVLKNIDHFFWYPQLSAAPNDFTLFNSGFNGHWAFHVHVWGVDELDFECEII